MAQSIPIDAYLGAHRTGLAIGATLYQLDGSTSYAAFSTSGWYEAPASSGAWHHAGLSLPDAGGVVAVGVSGTEYMRVAVEARQLLYSEYTAPDNATIGTINTRLGAPVGASISADIAGVQSDTNDIQTRLPAALVGGRIDANVGAISADATAADNAEAFFDGTGYAGTNNVIPTVTTVTNAVSANVTQISGDSTAADNLEAVLDGTGGVTITAGITGNVTGNLSGSVGSVVGNVGGSVASVTAGVSLADGAITAAKIAADAITAAKIADGAIDAATFATGAITASAIAADAITDAKVASDVTIAAVTGAVGSVTAGVTVTTNNDKTGYGLADGAITSAKFGAGAITSAVIATDAIDADALAADAVSEIQSGLATAAALATVDTVVDAILVDTAEIGVAGAGLTVLATQSSVNTIDDFLDTEIAAIKAKTDNLPATPANEATLSTIVSYLDTEVAAILSAVDTEVTAIKTVTDALPDSGALTTITNNVTAILADTGTDGVVVATSSKTGYTLSSAGVQAIWEYASRTLTSFGTLAADVWAYATRTLTSFGSLTSLISTVSAGNINVYANDTWSFSISNSSLALSGYEAVAFAVKASAAATTDATAILYVRSDTGLVAIGGATATAGDGTLTVNSNTQLSVKIAITATNVAPGRYTWWIKGYDTTTTPDEGYTLATGVFLVNPAGVRATE